MNFVRNQSQPVLVDWYFVPRGTPFIPYPTIFRSANYLNDEVDPEGLGEVPDSPRTYRTGATVGDGDASRVCGTFDDWRNGFAAPPAVPTPVDGANTPTCCNPGPPGPPIIHPGACCPTGAYATYRLTLAGIASSACDCTPLIGTWNLVYIGGCRWQSGPITFCGGARQAVFTLSLSPVEVPSNVRMDAGVGVFAEWTMGAWDCLSPATLTFASSAGTACLYPGTVSLSF
jgi:hypothetical protein